MAFIGDLTDDLSLRYEALRPFDLAELALVRAMVRQPERLSRRNELSLRRALNLARLWELPGRDDISLIEPLALFRNRLQPVVKRLLEATDLDPRTLSREASELEAPLQASIQSLFERFGAHFRPRRLQRELSHKRLVLALGGGGGTGWAHLGAAAKLERLGLRPALITGASAGALMGAFRARTLAYREAAMIHASKGLSLGLFKVLDTSQQHFSVPGALRLQLRGPLASFFQDAEGQPLRLKDLPIPFVSMVTGLPKESSGHLTVYREQLQKQLSHGLLQRVLHVRHLTQSVIQIFKEILRSKGLVSIALGADPVTEELDVIDAIGFSASLPGLLQYDIQNKDSPSHDILKRLLEDSGIAGLVDGGLTANVPAKAAWLEVQRGRLKTRNACVLALDSFAPKAGRHLPFLPLAKMAEDNVKKDREFAQLYYAYHHTPAPSTVLPRQSTLKRAVTDSRVEFKALGPLLQKLLEPIPMPFFPSEPRLLG